MARLSIRVRSWPGPGPSTAWPHPRSANWVRSTENWLASVEEEAADPRPTCWMSRWRFRWPYCPSTWPPGVDEARRWGDCAIQPRWGTSLRRPCTRVAAKPTEWLHRWKLQTTRPSEGSRPFGVERRQLPSRTAFGRLCTRRLHPSNESGWISFLSMSNGRPVKIECYHPAWNAPQILPTPRRSWQFAEGLLDSSGAWPADSSHHLDPTFLLDLSKESQIKKHVEYSIRHSDVKELVWRHSTGFIFKKKRRPISLTLN